MKIFFRFMIVINISLLSLAVQAQRPLIEFNQKNKLYTFSADKIKSQHVLSKFSLYSGIGIQYGSGLKEYIAIDLIKQTEQQVVSYLSQEYSTIKQFGKNSAGKKRLLKLKILPKGQYQTDSWYQALPDLAAATSYGTERSLVDEQATDRLRERLEQLPLLEQQEIDRMVSQQIKDQQQRAEHKVKSQAKKKQKKEKLISQLRELKNKDPEQYQRRLKINEWRYKGLQQQVESEI